MAKLTVLIPCKDERKNLRACVESVRGLADEILVADSGSTDGTLDIARGLGCRVIERELIDFSSFKNWAIPQALHPWVLILDADERVTPELAGEIRRTLHGDDTTRDGYWIGRQNYFMGHRIRHCGWNTDDVLRLIRRDVCRYTERRVHEEIGLPSSRAGTLRHKLEHYTVWTHEKYLDKLNHYTTLGARDLYDRGCRASFWGMILRPPIRFLQLYFLRLGFLDGLAGVQVCMLTAYTGLLKQAKLWALQHAIPQPDAEAAHSPAAAPHRAPHFRAAGQPISARVNI